MSLGTVVFQLDPFHAPMTTANLLAYVHEGFYDGTLFHRVMPNFVVQGGGFTSGLVYKTPVHDAVRLESNNGLSNLAGTVAMARTNVADSATSQFFVNLVDNTGLDYVSAAKPGYAVFGSVVSGMSVIQAMATQPTTTVGSYANVPQTELIIQQMEETTEGVSKSRTGVVSVGALESGAVWEYSLNEGKTWKKGQGTSFTLPVGTYAASTILVRQTDLAGNVSTHAGESSVTLVVEKTAPKLASVSPAQGATTVGVADSIVLTFDETVQLGTGAIVLKTLTGTVVETFQVTPGATSGPQWTLNPTKDLAYDTQYRLEITKGTFTDIAGNAFGGLKGYRFGTTDTVTTSAASYKLGDEVNKLVYSGTADFAGEGNAADNRLTAGSGNDTLIGGVGNDTLMGAAGDDKLLGDASSPGSSDGHDVLFGGDGNDNLWGGGGRDVLQGDGGNDILYGEDGTDTLVGGQGEDLFVLSKSTDAGTDLFADFKAGEDRMAFIGRYFSGLPEVLTESDFLGGRGKRVPDNGQHLIYDSKTGVLYYDEDGLAETAAVKLAIVGKASHPDLTIADFVVG